LPNPKSLQKSSGNQNVVNMFFIEFYHSNFPSHQFVIHQIVILGVPTIVRTNILIRSMGPVSELDMVSLAKSVANFNQKFAFFVILAGKGLFDGLLLPAILARSQT
jgi:hypothetical protein